MSNLKLISVRLDPETLHAIDTLALNHPYWKRNAIINQLLTTLVHCASYQTFWEMLSVTFSFDKGYVVKFEQDTEVLRQRSKEAKSEEI